MNQEQKTSWSRKSHCLIFASQNPKVQPADFNMKFICHLFRILTAVEKRLKHLHLTCTHSRFHACMLFPVQRSCLCSVRVRRSPGSTAWFWSEDPQVSASPWGGVASTTWACMCWGWWMGGLPNAATRSKYEFADKQTIIQIDTQSPQTDGKELI